MIHKTRVQEFTARNITPSNLSVAEIAIWENLATTLPSLSSPFLSPHYARAVAASGIDVKVCVIYQRDKICAFFPYQFRNRFLSYTKVAEPVGGEMTDYFGMIAEPGFRIRPTDLLRLAQINYLNFSHLDESQLGYGLSGEQPRTGLRARLNNTGERPLDTLLYERHRYLKDSERCARKLLNDFGSVEFVFDQQHNRQQVLENLVSQKREQYKRTNVPDSLKHSWKTNLLHKLSECQFSTCRGVLSTLSVGGKLIATHFGVMGNGIFQYWFPVYDPDYGKYAPGRLLLHKIIESSPLNSIHTIDHGEGDTSSKRELANDEHQYFRGVWHNRSVTSHVTRGLFSIKWRLGV